MVPGQTELIYLLPFILLAALAHADPAVDNSSINQRDRNHAALTADSQSKSSKDDNELSRQIRRELMKDNSLSIYGKNVKIITQNGITTLRGPVHTLAERNEVAVDAKHVAGNENVFNEIEVKQKPAEE
jgi:hyperosmotically inducible protein